MKILIPLLFIIIPFILFAQSDTLDTDSETVISTVKQEEDSAVFQNDTVTTVANDESRDSTSECACIPQQNELGGGQWLLVFLPAIIFISVAWILFSKGLKKFNFQEALKENELTTIIIPNPVYQNSTDPAKIRDISPTIEITANVTVEASTSSRSSLEREYRINEQSASYRASISRYIALVSSLMIIIIAVSLSSFFIYHYVRTSCPPVLEDLSVVLIALGLGIVPYAANKVSSAIAAKKSEV